MRPGLFSNSARSNVFPDQPFRFRYTGRSLRCPLGFAGQCQPWRLKMVECPSCGCVLPNMAVFCRNCGHRIGPGAPRLDPPSPSPRRYPAGRRRLAIALALIIVCGTLAALALAMVHEPTSVRFRPSDAISRRLNQRRPDRKVIRRSSRALEQPGHGIGTNKRDSSDDLFSLPFAVFYPKHSSFARNSSISSSRSRLRGRHVC